MRHFTGISHFRGSFARVQGGLLWALLIAFVGGLQSASAGTFALVPESAEVSFDAIGRPSALKIHGSSKQLQSKLERAGEQLSGSFEFPLESLDSGIALRDRHMKEKYLEVGRFPSARFEWKDWKLPATLAADEVKSTVSGKLTLHGVTQAVQADLSLQKKDEGIRVKADFTTQLSQYGIAIPSFAGITVAEDVKVHVEFTAVEK